jgi:uncharacterized membrane protein YccC
VGNATAGTPNSDEFLSGLDRPAATFLGAVIGCAVALVIALVWRFASRDTDDS